MLIFLENKVVQATELLKPVLTAPVSKNIFSNLFQFDIVV